MTPVLAESGEAIACGFGFVLGNVWVESYPDGAPVDIEAGDGVVLMATGSSSVLLSADEDSTKLIEVA